MLIVDNCYQLHYQHYGYDVEECFFAKPLILFLNSAEIGVNKRDTRIQIDKLKGSTQMRCKLMQSMLVKYQQ